MNRSALIAGVVIIGLVLTILLGFNLTRSKIESILQKEEITKISVFYQPDFTTFDMTDPEEIDGFLNIVLNSKIEKAEEDKQSTGYIYVLTLFNDDIEYGRLTLGNSLSIYPNEYQFVEGDIDQDTLIEYLDSTYKMNMDKR